MDFFGNLRRLFLAALGVGVFGIGVGSLVSFAPLALVFTLAFPLTAMVGYWAIANRRDRTVTETVPFADSLYYMGFLFTLIAIAMSLLPFSKEEVRTSDLWLVVVRFGTALLTTIVGLGARVYLVNFRPDQEASRTQIEAELADAGRQLRQQIRSLNTTLVVETDAWRAAISNVVETANAQLRASYAAGGAAIEEAASQFAETTIAGSEELKGALGGLSVDLSRVAENIETATSQLRSQISAFQVSEDTLTTSLQPALDNLVNSLEGCSNAVRRINLDPSHTAESLGRLGTALDQSASQAENLSQGISSIDATALAQVGVRFESVLGALEAAARAHDSTLASLESELKKTSALTDAHRAALEADLASSQDALSEVSKAMVSAARFVTSSLSK